MALREEKDVFSPSTFSCHLFPFLFSVCSFSFLHPESWELWKNGKGLCYICARIPPIQTSYTSKLPCQALGDNSIGQMLACNHEDPSWVPETVIKPGMAWTCQLSVGKGEAGGSPDLTGKPNESLRDPGGWILKINPGAWHMHTYLHKHFHTQECAYTHVHTVLFLSLSVDLGFQQNEVEVLEISLIPPALHVHGLLITISHHQPQHWPYVEHH